MKWFYPFTCVSYIIGAQPESHMCRRGSWWPESNLKFRGKSWPVRRASTPGLRCGGYPSDVLVVPYNSSGASTIYRQRFKLKDGGQSLVYDWSWGGVGEM